MGKMVDIASLWKPKPEDGPKKYKLSGKTKDGRKCYLFENDKGDNPKRPDYRLMVSGDEGEGDGDDRTPF